MEPDGIQAVYTGMLTHTRALTRTHVLSHTFTHVYILTRTYPQFSPHNPSPAAALRTPAPPAGVPRHPASSSCVTRVAATLPQGWGQ